MAAAGMRGRRCTLLGFVDLKGFGCNFYASWYEITSRRQNQGEPSGSSQCLEVHEQQQHACTQLLQELIFCPHFDLENMKKCNFLYYSALFERKMRFFLFRSQEASECSAVGWQNNFQPCCRQHILGVLAEPLL